MLILDLLSSLSAILERTFAMPAMSEVDAYEVILKILDKAAVCIFSNGQQREVDEAVFILKNAGVEKFSFYDLFSAGSIHSNSQQEHDEAAGGQGQAKDESLECLVLDFQHHNSPRTKNIVEKLLKVTCRPYFPLIFIRENCVGGVTELKQLADQKVLPESLKKHEYDLIVIGGGSGGIAAAKKAAEMSKKVAVLDFVKPTPLGTTWGLGGTCVNVGCIPKKLMHQAAILGKSLSDAKKFGWQYGQDAQADWKTLTSNIKNHILSLNYGCKVDLRQLNATYVNGYGSFVDSHTIKSVQKDGKETQMTADRFLIATGVRPRYPGIPGDREYCITSDDLFYLPYSPGKTLVVGASYVALECAGFLHGLGYDTTVMVRSIFLRGFDQDISERIGKHMEESGIKFIRKSVPLKVEKIDEGTPGLLRVTYVSKDEKNVEVVATGEYNTVLLAIGRDAVTDDLNLPSANVMVNKNSKKVICMNNEQSVTAPHIYAIGDVSQGRPELTPVAIQAGRLLVDRMFSFSFDLCDYENVPTTVFTPLEYGCCGLSEESAKEKYGTKAVVFHSRITPLEFTVAKRKLDMESCYAKIIFHGDDDENPKELRLVGIHYLGPNAGEVVQGFAIAFKLNATMADFQSLIGIHPTVAEVFTFTSMVIKTDAPLEAKGC